MMKKFYQAKASVDSLKVVVLAGGSGTRLAEETEIKPKPMVKVGSQVRLRDEAGWQPGYD